MFRTKMIRSDKALIRNELGRRVLSICSHSRDVNIRREQLNRGRSPIMPPTTISLECLTTAGFRPTIVSTLFPAFPYSWTVLAK